MIKCKIDNCQNHSLAQGLCQKHYSRFRRYQQTELPLTRRKKLISNGFSYCPTCEKEKPLEEFNKDNHTCSGYSIYCRDCRQQKCRTIYSRKGCFSSGRVKVKSGMSYQQYLILLKNQNNKCAICKRVKQKHERAFAVDHCHKTHQIRGILCRSCNLGLGLFKDNKDNLKLAIDYLTKSSANV